MLINDCVLQNKEKVIFALRELYLSHGYSSYRMSKFEEYDLYAGNKDFLVSDNVITFTDTDGKLMALKPDVTLSIIKNSVDAPDTVKKVFYDENIYRISKGTGLFKEITQAGAECFGNVGIREICEVLSLAAKSLSVLSRDYRLAVSDLAVINSIVSSLSLDAESVKRLYLAIGEKNIQSIDTVCAECENRYSVTVLKKLLLLHGGIKDLLPELKTLIGDIAPDFINILGDLKNSAFAPYVMVDFSVIGDINYYNGIVFKGFVRDIPSDVLSGGQYDRLMQKMGKRSKAIGFAVYTDLIERCDIESEDNVSADDIYINIALPKGRLGEKIYRLFEDAGFECPSILEPNRKLIFENPQKHVRYFWVKPSDVPIYVERGAADIGVAGKDILLEYEPDVYELIDLKQGKCRMAVAAPDGYRDDPSKKLRVATKFANIAKKYYRSMGRDIDIIHLNGSIEIAPILKLSDVIVDIVETGTTLKENSLSVISDIIPISARLIANKSSYKFKLEMIRKIADELFKITE